MSLVDVDKSWRHAKVTDQPPRTPPNARAIAEDHYPDAERICVVLDNLSTHNPADLWERVEPAEARQISIRLEVRFTTTNASSLNIVEIEIERLAGSASTGRTARAMPRS